jgi:two-component system secretion system response regulator SalR
MGGVPQVNIVYVEDDPANVLLLDRVTYSTGVALLPFQDAESALESGAIGDADLLLVDIHLPGALNGLDMTEVLRDHGVDVPVVMITAYDLPDYVQRTRALGGDQYLVKPVSVSDLMNLLNGYRM